MKYVLQIKSWTTDYVEISFGDFLSVEYDNDPSIDCGYSFQISAYDFLKFGSENYKNVRIMGKLLIGYMKMEELKTHLMIDWK